MPIKRKHRVTRSTHSSIGMSVSLVGMKITVHAGTFRANKTDFELLEDEEAIVPEFIGGGRLTLNLVKDRDDDGEVRILADFVHQDESVYNFSASTRFDLLHMLVDAKVPEGISSLEEAHIRVWDIVEEIPND